MKAEDLRDVQRVLWAAADEMRANSSLGPAEMADGIFELPLAIGSFERHDSGEILT